MEVEFTLPSEGAFDLVNQRLHAHGRRFKMLPSQLLRALLAGRIIPIRREGCLVISNGCDQATTVVFDVPDRESLSLIRAMREWPETHDGLTFGDFLLNVALGHYDIVEAPRRQTKNNGNGHARPRCRVCGRPLTSPEAIVKGIGPVCEAKLQTMAA